jgi:hypothetical protein
MSDFIKPFKVHCLPNLTPIPYSVLRQFHRIFQRALHSVWSNVFSFNFRYPVISLKSSISCLRLLRRLPVTYILPSIFSVITCFIRQFLCKMWPVHLEYFLCILCRIFLSPLTLRNTLFFTWSDQMIFSSLLQHQISKFSTYFFSTFRSVQVSAP